MQIKSKLPNTPLSIFAKMTALANQHGAINLAQGFPDFASNPQLINLVTEAMQNGHNQYAPMAGVMALREGIAQKVEQLYNVTYNPESEITITAGGTQAIYTIMSALVHDGDEVILFEPAYDCYGPSIKLAGGRPVYIQLQKPQYAIDWQMVKKCISSKTKAIIINSPHNPTGAVMTHDDMLQLEKITAGSDIIIVSDEVYEHIIFDGTQHESLLRYPSLKERSVVVFSFGKTYHNTGWKIGYVIAEKALTHELRMVHQFLLFSVNTPIQHALAKFILLQDEYANIASFYQKKRDYFIQMLSTSKFGIQPTKGTYFQLLDYSQIAQTTDLDFALELTEKFKVASIPLSPFYKTPVQSKVLRFCFAKTDETLEKAAEILCKI